MDIAGSQFAAISYGVGCAGFGLFIALLVGRGLHSNRGKLFVGTIAANFLWAASGTWLSVDVGPSAWLTYQALDAARAIAWTWFIALLLAANRGPMRTGTLSGLGLGTRIEIAIAAALPLVAAGAWIYMPSSASYAGNPLAAGAGAWVLHCVIGLMLCEQMYRGTADSARWPLKPLCVALGAIYGYDLFLFSDALLMRKLDAQFWGIRGFTHALTIPLLMLATVRHRDWAIDIGVSRSVVFGSTALLLCGVYLLGVSAIGYYVRLFGGDWGRGVQAAFLFVALIVLAILFVSRSIRARLKVFVSKHFFSYRYDYRAEWLKFTEMLATPGEDPDLKTRCIKALADLVESPGGQIWLAGEGHAYRQAARWNMARFEHSEPDGSEFVVLLKNRGWVVDLSAPEKFTAQEPHVHVPAWLTAMPEAWLTVPLPNGSELLGFVILAKPRISFEINWEVLDLLKTGARQAAAVLGQVRATEALVEAQQLNAFSRMSAYIVHDLKNLVAQLSLMLKNAERHAQNPEFQRDMLSTVEHVVSRMNQLLMQLRSGATPITKPVPVDLAQSVTRIHDIQSRQGRKLEVELTEGLRTIAHEDRIERIIGHLVQNAFDATEHGGSVKIRLYAQDPDVVVEVRDTGTGMTEEFVREHLFRLFRSTKSSGMGIGTYEIRQYVNELGGKVVVESEPRQGTRFALYLPGFNSGSNVTSQEIADACPTSANRC